MNKSASDATGKIDPLKEVTDLVAETVSDYRSRGHTKTLAIELTATVLEITQRRARALLYGEAFQGSENERLAVGAAFNRHLCDQIKFMEQRLEAIRAERKRIELEIESEERQPSRR